MFAGQGRSEGEQGHQVPRSSQVSPLSLRRSGAGGRIKATSPTRRNPITEEAIGRV